MSDRRSHGLFESLPVYAFLAIYVATCAIGAVLFLVPYEEFALLYEYFSGAGVPRLEPSTAMSALALLILCPVLLWAGFVGGRRLSQTHGRRLPQLPEVPTTPLRRLVGLSFVASAIVALTSFLRSGLLANTDAWGDYASYVAARYVLFENLGFFEFVNIYVVLPALGAFYITLTDFDSSKSKARAAAILFVVGGIGLLVFQKRVVIVNLLICAIAISLYLLDARPVLARRVLGVGAVALAILYTAMVVLPVYSETSRTIAEAEELRDRVAAAQESSSDIAPLQTPDERRLQFLAEQLDLDAGNRLRQVTLYALMAPLSRTSSSALLYPQVFPAQHPFYGLDVGQDILGIGAAPDDGSVVWDYSNPDIPGSTTAPYQFVLYSQVGLVGAMLGSVILGLFIGLAWWGARVYVPPVFRPIVGTVVVLFCVLIAADGWRTSFFSSYGVLWFAVLLVSLAVTAVLGRRILVPWVRRIASFSAQR